MSLILCILNVTEISLYSIYIVQKYMLRNINLMQNYIAFMFQSKVYFDQFCYAINGSFLSTNIYYELRAT